MTTQPDQNSKSTKPPDIQADQASNTDVPVIHTLPKEIKELKALRAREKKSLSNYRDKLKALIAELQDSLANARAAVNDISRQKLAADNLSTKLGEQSSQVSERYTNAESLVSETEELLAKARSLAPRIDEIEETWQRIDSLANKSAERSKHIEDGFQYVQATKPKVESAVAEIGEAKSTVKTIAEELSQSKGRVETIESNVSELYESAKESVDAVDDQVLQFSKRNKELVGQGELLQHYIDQSKSLTEEVESLLPGAASAGLASSFKANADELNWSIRLWESMSVLALVGLAAYGLVYGIGSLDAVKEMVVAGNADGAVLNTDQILTLLAMVLLKGLVAVPIVWLVLFAGHRGSKQKRVREDYRYKAAIAMAFQGFKNQFEDIDSDSDLPVHGLSKNVLKSLAAEPGRLYDTKYQEVTPVSAAADAIARATKGRKGKIKAAGIEAELESDRPENEHGEN